MKNGNGNARSNTEEIGIGLRNAEVVAIHANLHVLRLLRRELRRKKCKRSKRQAQHEFERSHVFLLGQQCVLQAEAGGTTRLRSLRSGGWMQRARGKLVGEIL